MKKILVASVIASLISTSAYAEVSFTQKLRNFGQQMTKTADDIDAKIVEQEKKALEQQKKYEEVKAKREQKILEQQKAREELLNARQKRLEEKREQLRKLLEE